MTVAAIDTVVADVMFVAELDWLLSFDPLSGVPRRTIQLNCDPEQRDGDENSAIDRDFRQRVSTVVEDLGHCRRIREGTSHRYRLGDTVAHKPFAVLNVYCKVFVLYQIDRDFQIGFRSACEELRGSIAGEQRNTDWSCIRTEFCGDDLGRFKTAKKGASLNFLDNRIEY